MANRGRPPVHGKTNLDENLDAWDLMERDAKKKIESSGRVEVGNTIKLVYPQDKDPNFFYYWAVHTEKTVNDIQTLLERGFEFDRYRGGTNKGNKVHKRYKGVDHYGMRQPLELRAQDLEKGKQKREMQYQKNAQGMTVEQSTTISSAEIENPDILKL